MMKIPDYPAREQALDPTQSFIVQAPAGSGKTELLTQRFLKLLSCVNEPEEILAITFTKKAASEMRCRIRDALRKAQHSPLPEAPHEKKTWQLAQNALKQDQNKKWGLLINPNRLRIKTIDAFNTLLTRQLPLLSNFGASPEIMDYPWALYREAVQTFLADLEENVMWSQAIAQLLLHLDNNLAAVEELLIEMLSRRDHWLPHIVTDSLRRTLEANREAIIEEALNKLKAAFPKDCIPELLKLLQFACPHLRTIHPDSPLLCCEHLSHLPGTKASDKAVWLGLAELLLTQDETWRKNVDKNLGFPGADKKKSKGANDLHALHKQKMKSLLESLSQHEPLRQALVDLRYLPDAHYTESQWEILKALQAVLKIAVAQLHVIFKWTGKIDYTENALAALLALGTEETPTDLALVLDYQLKHILVDEFQDTSSNQYELLKKLVRGWQAGDGRTLFLVGDPMQSIYRFREANVGLFLRTRAQGLGSISLKPLTLTLNFRATPLIVEWINHHFNRVLPAYDDIATGAVSYTASANCEMKETAEGRSVELHSFLESEGLTQTQGIIQLIQQTLQKNPTENIAILVRSRNHLKTLIPALKSANLSYQAVEIDPLERRPLIQDLLALTRALLYPADHIAWLSILRAPWCGLSLNDLLVLAGNRKQDLIFQCLEQSDRELKLSSEGRAQVKRVLPVLKTALAERHREDLHLWIENTWLALGGPACLDAEEELQDAKIFFGLLKKIKWDSFEEALQQLYAQALVPTDCRIQIMTIHNAKGLEFDTVILPHLEKGAGKGDKPLLTWLEQPLVKNTTVLLLAPIHAVGEEEDKLYRHIRRQDKIKTQHEQGRLLYVAATRARKALHLCMTLEANERGEYKLPPESSLLKKIWPAIQHELRHSLIQSRVATEKKGQTHFFIKRLKEQWTHPVTLRPAPERPAHNKIQGFHFIPKEAQIVGTVVHHVLQQISRFGLLWWNNKPREAHHAYLKQLFIKNGLLGPQQSTSLEKVEKAILNTLSDNRGQWLLQEHPEAQAELPLTAVIEGEVKTVVIDRTFIGENGLRWIIDYKTSLPEKQTLPSFLQEEQEKYARKMRDYQTALASLDSRPIRLGLYFPLVPAWCEWE
jgi:ATP-dependent exoDNAse (exonuclease V) beta subunit